MLLTTYYIHHLLIKLARSSIRKNANIEKTSANELCMKNMEDDIFMKV